MASNLKLAVQLKNLRLNQYNSQIGASGFFKGYSGTQPTNPDTALAGNTLLFNLPLSSSFASAASLGAGGVLTANPITTESAADGTGTLTFCSLTTSGGTRIADMTAGTSGADVTVNSTAISSGAQVSCSSFTITAGN